MRGFSSGACERMVLVMLKTVLTNGRGFCGPSYFTIEQGVHIFLMFSFATVHSLTPIQPRIKDNYLFY